MKRQGDIMKKTASVVLAAFIAVTGLSALSAGVSAEWVKSGTTYSYRDESGNKLRGWQEIDGNKSYFDKEENLTNTSMGYAVAVYAYDELGNKVGKEECIQRMRGLKTSSN